MRAVVVADLPRGLSIPSAARCTVPWWRPHRVVSLSAARFYTSSRQRPPPPTPLPLPNHRRRRPSPLRASSTATSADAAPPHVTDREERRRRLDAALESLRTFRRWCSTQLHQQHGHRKSTAGVATLADASDASLSDTAAAAAAAVVAAPSPPTTLSPVEHRLLTHHATLLHAVQVAAMRTSTADYQARYAPAVAAALLAPSSPTSSPHPFAIPRTDVWAGERAVAAASTDVVAQAERRLMHWSAQWHREAHAWHAKDRTSSAAAEERRDEPRRAEDAGDALAQLPVLLLRGDWQAALHHLTSIPATTTTTAATSSSHVPVEVLFSMASLRHRRRAWLKPQSPGTFPRFPKSWAVAAVTAVETRLLQSPPSAGLRVDHDSARRGNVAEGEMGEEVGGVRGDMSSSSSAANDRSAYPSSQVLRLRRRLWVLQHLPRALPPSLIHFTEAKRGHRGGPLRYAAALPHPYMLRGDAVERLPWYPLCVLGQALELAAASTTSQSAEHRSSDHVGSDAADVTVQRTELLCAARHQLSAALFFYDSVDYAALLDYVHLLFVSVGSTMLARHVATTTNPTTITKGCGSGSGAQAVALAMERVFAETAIALLQPPAHTAYAAQAEVMSGEDGRDNTVCTEITAARTTATGLVDAPPSILDWTAVLGRVEKKGGAAAAQASRRDGSGNRTAPPTPTDIPATRCVSAAVFAHICRCVQQRRNYHTSLYCETLSQVCDGAGVAMTELGRVLSQQQQQQPTLNTEAASAAPSSSQEAVVVVLAPESAAAITAAVLLQRLAQPPTAETPADHVPSVLFFAVPHAKAHAVASYFKGLFDPTFFQRVCVDSCGAATSTSSTTTATIATDGPALVLPADAWEGSAAARLVGRSMRRVDRYPCRTTEAFVAPYIRGDDVRQRGGGGGEEKEGRDGAVGEERSHMAPALMIDFYTVDLHAAVAHWRSQPEHHQQQSTTATPVTAAAASVIAAPPQLPHGLHAVYKPAEMTCTLHAHYPTLIYPLLSQQLPWRNGGGGNNTLHEGGKEGEGKMSVHTPSPLSSSPLPPLVVPVLHQQGLVNRIDVGTSGVVFVARDAASLHAATDAMVRCHQTRKTYRALVQRWPPLLTPAALKGDGTFSLSTSQQLQKQQQQQQQQQRGKDWKAQRRAAERNIEASFFSASPFLSSLPSALICAPVFAAGATAATIPSASASSTERDGGDVAALGVASQQQQQQREGERYSRLHAALHDRRPALTWYRVLEWFPATGVAYVQVVLESGRRHQIRQHFAQLGFPLVADVRYHAGVAEGRAGTCFGLRRAALHAYAVDLFVSPEDGEGEAGRVVVQAPLPADMLRAVQTLRALEKSAKGPAA